MFKKLVPFLFSIVLVSHVSYAEEILPSEENSEVVLAAEVQQAVAEFAQIVREDNLAPQEVLATVLAAADVVSACEAKS